MAPPSLTAVGAGLPERLSALQSDARYDARAKGLSGRIDVLLDGKVLDEVSTYDVPAGEVMRKQRRRDGSVILDDRGIPTFELLKGKVEVRWSLDESAPA